MTAPFPAYQRLHELFLLLEGHGEAVLNNYPGGRDRVDAQLAGTLDSHQKRFGAAPADIWPAEDALYRRQRDLYRPYRLNAHPEPVLCFHDERLMARAGELRRGEGKAVGGGTMHRAVDPEARR